MIRKQKTEVMVALGSEPSSSVWSKTRFLSHHADYSDSQQVEATRRLISAGRETGQSNHQSFPGGASGKEPVCQCRRHKKQGFDPWVGKTLWRRAWQPAAVFLPGESHGQRSLVGFSP